MPIHTIKLDNPHALYVVMGQIPFVKTAEEIHAALVVTVPEIKFGIAFNEPAAPPVVKHFGTDETLIELARKSADNIAVRGDLCAVLGWNRYCGRDERLAGSVRNSEDLLRYHGFCGSYCCG
ncbi:hypothetical protein IIA29_05930 [candidate division KSB1 bacterium]|nr:hypothetical protein [candidate division KSB1 bacterium]